MRLRPSRLLPAVVALTTLGLTPLASPASAGSQPAASPVALALEREPAAPRAGEWKPRPAQYDGTVTYTDLEIPMDDGVVLRGDLTRPTLDGEPVPGRLPVIITITAYNKTLLSSSPLGGPGGDYLVSRGYQTLVVDARGTGSSAGLWKAFSPRENKDATAIVNWAHEQPWSDGTSGMIGPSYMGISQVFAAAGRPKGLKAIFPQVPGGDVYRDVVASGGQIDVGFIPLWLGLVTGTGLIPPAYGAGEPQNAFQWALDHLTGAGSFTVPLMAQALLGQEPAYDGRFYRDRSPIEVIDRVKVPTFFVSGEYDLFQRGTPLLFERLRKNGVPTRIITGPWDHLEASAGTDLADAGYGTLEELQLRWFDRYVMGRRDPALLTDIKPYTYYEIGRDRWVRTSDYVAKDLEAKTFRLSGASVPGLRAGRLTTSRPNAGSSVLPPLPTAGLCTRSANQWTAGIMNAIPVPNPCLEHNELNDLQTVVFETAPLKKPLRVQGPMNARLFVSSPTGDGMLAVTVELARERHARYVTGGWQVISHRKLAVGRSRYVDGELVQPYHPFTRAAKKRARPNQIVPVDVEIFPTGLMIRKGSKLRISISSYDVPHLLAPLTDLPLQAAPLRIHTGPKHPSALTVLAR